MTEIPISPDVWKLAKTILTQKQLVVLELREKHGYSWHQISVTLNCVRATAKEHHRAATKNLLDAIEAAGGIDQALSKATTPEPEVTREQKVEVQEEGYPPTAQPRPRSGPTARDPARRLPRDPHPRTA
jgi:DNA uptake protein ComE-like DNA-binding protein